MKVRKKSLVVSQMYLEKINLVVTTGGRGKMTIDLSWIDGVIGFIAGMIVMAAVIIVGCAIGRDKGGVR